MTMRPYPPMHPLTPAKKETSYRPDIKHPKTERSPEGRNLGCTPLRRFPNGVLDTQYVVDSIVEIVHKAESGGKLNSIEMALISVIIPGRYCHIMDSMTANTKLRMADEEKLMVAIKVMAHFNEELNFNAGRGGGSVPGRSVTKQ